MSWLQSDFQVETWRDCSASSLKICVLSEKTGVEGEYKQYLVRMKFKIVKATQMLFLYSAALVLSKATLCSDTG